MTTLYVHPADSSSNQEEYESNARQQYERKPKTSNMNAPPRHQNVPHYQSPRHLNQRYGHARHRSQQQYTDDSTNAYTDEQLQSVPPCQSAIPPPKLFFPVDEECVEEDKANINKADSAKLNPGQQTVINNINNSNKSIVNLCAVPPVNSINANGFHVLPLPITNLPALPPLSALTSDDAELLSDIQDLGRLKQLSVSEIQKELTEQRVKNETLLGKLHNDQKKFVKVCKHYERKNSKFAKVAEAVAKQNNTSMQSANVLRSLLVEHKSEMDKLQQENFQCQMSKSALWKEVATNMQLLTEVNALNKQIDAYHLLIAKKNQERNAVLLGIDDQKDGSEDASLGKAMDSKEVRVTDDDSKEVMNDGTSMVCATTEDPSATYAEQLISRNKRYHEILALLREKVDELRACRKQL